MGLDSVELLMTFETYFGIQVPDLEAENINTVQDMVDSAAGHLNITDDSKDLNDQIFNEVQKALLTLHLADRPIQKTDFIFNFLPPDNKDLWNSFSENLNLKVPKPYLGKQPADTIIGKVANIFRWTPNYDYKTITAEQFATAICADNYIKFADNKNIKNTYEIYIAIIAITVDKIGVDFYEVTPDKSFVKDLGID